MTDLQAHLDKIRSDAAECLLLGSLVPDDKRAMFVKVSEHLNTLAFEIERTMAINGSKAAVAAPQPADTRQTIDVNKDVAGGDLAVAQKARAKRLRRTFPWLLAGVLGLVAGAFFWTYPQGENYSTLFKALSKSVQSKLTQEPQLPHEEAKKKTATLASVEQQDRVLQEQMGAVFARIDNLQKALDGLKNSGIEGSNKKSVETVQKADNSPLTPPDGSSRIEGSGLSISPAATGLPTPSTPDAVKPPVATPTNLPATSGSSHNEEVDRVGSIANSGATELDQRKAIGPVGCLHFRSFDPLSGTYLTFDGRRRPCR